MSPSVGVCPASEPRMCGEEIEKQTESVWEENRLRGGWVTCQRSSQCQVGSEASWAAPARALYSPAQLVSVIWGCLWGEARCCAGLGRVGWRERRLRWQKGRVCSSARLGELMGAVDLKGHMVYRKRALFHATHAQSLTSWSAVSHHYKGDGYKSGLSFYLSRFHFGLKWQICTFLFGHPLLIYCDFFFYFYPSTLLNMFIYNAHYYCCCYHYAITAYLAIFCWSPLCQICNCTSHKGFMLTENHD